MNFRNDSRSSVPEIDLTPLINIVFLMLIFFMLAGTLKPSDNIQSAQMDGGSVVQDDMLVVSIDAQGILMIERNAIEIPALLQRLQSHSMSGGMVGIKPDARLAAEQLMEVSELLRQSGFSQMTLIVDAP